MITVGRDIREELEQALYKVDRPGSFCAVGSAPTVLPGLEVHGLGPIGLPLTASQAKELIKRCEQAPHGKGEETLVDTKVRRVWRLKPDHFKLTNPEWKGFIERDGRQGPGRAGAGEAEAPEPSLRPLALRAGELLPAPPRRREAGPDGRDAGRRAPLGPRRRRARRPARGARAGDRFRRPGGQAVPHPLRRVLRRLRARGPPLRRRDTGSAWSTT